MCEHVCAYSCLCLPIRNRLLWLPHCERGVRGRKDGLLLPSRPEASSECVQCTCILGEWGEQDTYMKTVEMSVLPYPYPTSALFCQGETIFSSFCHKPMLHIHHLPASLGCVCVCVCVCTQTEKHRLLCVYFRVCGCVCTTAVMGPRVGCSGRC